MVNPCRCGTFLEILSAVLNYFNYCLLTCYRVRGSGVGAGGGEGDQEAEHRHQEQAREQELLSSSIKHSRYIIIICIIPPSFTWSNASTRSPSARLISPQYNLPCLAMVITARAGSQNCPAGCRKYPPSVAIPRQSGLLNFDIDTTSICIILRK